MEKKIILIVLRFIISTPLVIITYPITVFACSLFGIVPMMAFILLLTYPFSLLSNDHDSDKYKDHLFMLILPFTIQFIWYYDYVIKGETKNILQ